LGKERELQYEQFIDQVRIEQEKLQINFEEEKEGLLESLEEMKKKCGDLVQEGQK